MDMPEKKVSSTDEQTNPVTTASDQEEDTESGHSLGEEIANAVQEGEPGPAKAF
jgi:hypothetical protein